MSTEISLIGEKFNRLFVIEEDVDNTHARKKYLCNCECGKTVSVFGYNLKNGNSKSCGCLQKENPNRLTHGKTKSRLYNIWVDMKQRCNKNCKSTHKYWANRGITVCGEWLKFETFYDWAHANGYKEHLTIDRIDNNGNYEPSNCKWSTYKQQANNSRSNVIVDIGGEKMNMSTWSKKLGIPYTTFVNRVKRGFYENITIAKGE